MGSYWGFIEVSFFFILPFFLRELRRTASPLDANGLLLPAVAIQRPIKVTTAIGGGGGTNRRAPFFHLETKENCRKVFPPPKKKRPKPKTKQWRSLAGRFTLSLSLFFCCDHLVADLRTSANSRTHSAGVFQVGRVARKKKQKKTAGMSTPSLGSPRVRRNFFSCFCFFLA